MGYFPPRIARDNGSIGCAAPSSRGFRAEVLPSLTNAFYVFSRDYFARSATPDTSRERACLQTSLWQMATESGRVRLRRDPRGNPTERSIPLGVPPGTSRPDVLYGHNSRLVPSPVKLPLRQKLFRCCRK